MTNANELNLQDLDQVSGGFYIDGVRFGPTPRTERMIEMERAVTQLQKNEQNFLNEFRSI
jgi:hypothetical protein